MNVPWDELLKRLDAMAAKMGVAAGEVWRILVRQAYIEGITSWVWTAVAAIVVGVCLKYFIRGVKWINDDYTTEDQGWVTVIGCGIVGVVFAIVFCLQLTDAIQYTLNPQFYALQHILNVLK